ncbi:hypothetical protein BC828DRAFT_380194 [Blastocladiella britannica]|nr:hypothetical protein BC828DRAFT_380194 [Blastocladiella britannica]
MRLSAADTGPATSDTPYRGPSCSGLTFVPRPSAPWTLHIILLSNHCRPHRQTGLRNILEDWTKFIGLPRDDVFHGLLDWQKNDLADPAAPRAKSRSSPCTAARSTFSMGAGSLRHDQVVVGLAWNGAQGRHVPPGPDQAVSSVSGCAIPCPICASSVAPSSTTWTGSMWRMARAQVVFMSSLAGRVTTSSTII